MDYKFPMAIENLLPVDISRIINCQLFQKEKFDDVINEIDTLEVMKKIKECVEYDDIDDEDIEFLYKHFFNFLKIYKTPEYISLININELH